MYLDTSDAEQIAEAVARRAQAPDGLAFFMIGGGGGPAPQRLVAALNRRGLPFFGGVFPGLLHEGTPLSEGVLVAVLPAWDGPFVLEHLSEPGLQLPPDLRVPPSGGAIRPTAIVLVDGRAGGIGTFLSVLFRRLGHAVSYFGGGAGSLTGQRQPCLFTPQGCFQDAAVVALLHGPASLQAHHGWTRSTGPFVATRTRHNRIEALDWENAFSVYRGALLQAAGVHLTEKNFAEVAARYPFGLHREGSEDVVRAPVQVQPDGSLVCIGAVPENTVLYLLQRNGAARTALDAPEPGAFRNIAPGSPDRNVLVAACASRAHYLREDFAEELSMLGRRLAAADLEAPKGMLTLGQIASSGRGCLELLNQSVVTAVFHPL